MLKARRSDRPPAKKKRINKKNNTIKNSYNLKLGFIKKYIIYIFLSLIILFIGFTFIAPMFVNLKVWKPEIISMLESETGKTAEIKGDIELSIYPSPQIKVYGISLQDEKAGVFKNFLNSNSVVAKLSLLPLLKGNIVIDKIIFEDLNINLESFPNQNPNWAFNKKENVLQLDNDEFNDDYLKFNYIKYPNIKINEYLITKGSVVYNNEYKINLEDVVISNNNNAEIIKGSLNINGITFSLNSSFINNNDTEKSFKSSLSLINKDIKIITSGNLNYDNYYPSLEGSLEISSNNLENLSKNYKYFNLLNNKLKIISKLSLNFKKTDLFYSIYNLSINSGPFILTGAVSGNSGESPNVNIILSSNNMDLDLLRGNLNKYNNFYIEDKEEGLVNAGSYWDSYKGTFLLSIGTSKLLKYPIRDVVIDLKKEDKNYILNNAKATFPGNTNISFKGNFKNNFSVFEGASILNSDNIRDFYKWLSIDLNNISDSRLRKTKINSNVVFREGGATFAGIIGQIDLSNITGEVRLRFTELNSLFANLKIDKINLDAYLEENTAEQSISYKNNFNMFAIDNFNIDLDIGQILILKNQYNNIKFMGLYKNNILQIDKLNILDFAKGDLKLNGNINYNSKKTIYDLTIDINHKDFTEFYSFYKLPTYFRGIFVDQGKVAIIAKGEENSIFSNIKIETPQLNIVYEGDLKIENLSLLGYEGKLNLSINNLSQFFPVSSKNNVEEKANYFSDILMKNNLIDIRNIIFESPRYKYKGDINISYLENKNIELNVDIFSNSTSINDIKNIYNYFNVNSNLPTKGSMKLQAELFNINNFKIHNLDSLIYFNEEEIHLKKIYGTLFDGTLLGTGKRSNKNEYEYNGHIKFSNIDGKKLINNYFAYNNVDTEISSKLQISGKAFSVDEFFKTIKAEGEVFIKNPVIEGLDTNKLVAIKNIKSKSSLDKFVFESFKTNKNAEIESFSTEYIIENNKLLIKNLSLKIDKFNALLNGKFDLKNKYYNSSLKISLEDNNTKNIFINFMRDKNTENKYVESNYILDEISHSDDTIDKAVISNKDDSNEGNIIDNFDNIINDLFKDSDLEEFNNQNLLDNKKESISNTVRSDKTEEDNNIVLEPFIIISKLPEYLKGIKNPINLDYSKPSLIKNNLVKPKLPTQEDLLDDLLDSVLNPDN